MKKMKPAFAKAKGYMDGGMVGGGYYGGGMVGGGGGDSQRMGVMQDAAAARGSGGGRNRVMKMADGGYVCGHAGKMNGKNMKKGSK